MKIKKFFLLLFLLLVMVVVMVQFSPIVYAIEDQTSDTTLEQTSDLTTETIPEPTPTPDPPPEPTPEPTPEPSAPLISITLPSTGIVGIPITLTGTVQLADANLEITWSVDGAGVTIEDNMLYVTEAGTVTVTVTVLDGIAQGENYTYIHQITFEEALPVTGISHDLPPTGTVGIPITLSGTVEPADATHQTIIWSATGAGAEVTDYYLNVTQAGTVTITATVVDGIAQGQDFETTHQIVFEYEFVAVMYIDHDFPDIAIAGGIPILLTGTVQPDTATNQDITWTVHHAGNTDAIIFGNNYLFIPEVGAGAVVVRATVLNGETSTTPFTYDFTITINAYGDGGSPFISIIVWMVAISSLFTLVLSIVSFVKKK